MELAGALPEQPGLLQVEADPLSRARRELERLRARRV